MNREDNFVLESRIAYLHGLLYECYYECYYALQDSDYNLKEEIENALKGTDFAVIW